MIPLTDLAPGVHPTEDNLVFLVDSNSRPGVGHRVDLATYSGHGSCGCERFMFFMGKKIQNCNVPTAEMECSHLTAARRYLAIAVAQRLIQMRSGQDNPTMTRKEWGVAPW
jgi:hypothetical protein